MNIVQQKDTTFTKIFVGGLPYHTTDKTLREFFQQFGEIEEAVVITDRQTGKSRGYGFVTMSDRKSTEQACLDPNPIIDGRKANVNLAYLGAKPRIPAADLMGLPFGLKTSGLALPGYMTGQLPFTQASYPHQYIYPYIGLSSHAPVTISTPLVTTGPYLDYSTGAGMHPSAAYTTFQLPTGAPGSPAGYDMAAFSPNGTYMPQGAFCPSTISLAALPHQGAIGHYASHFQPAQIQ